MKMKKDVAFQSFNNFRITGLLASLTLTLALIAGFSLAAVAFAEGAAGLPALLAQGQSSYADTVSRVTPAVVTVRASRVSRASERLPFMDDPMFREFFGERFRQEEGRGQERLERGLGSGVIVSADGYLLTNHHVVDGAEDIRIELTDGRTLQAKVIGTDPPSDLALLKIEASGLPVLPLGDSDRARVGDVVLAVGNPLGVGQTVTSGIISAKGRQTGLAADSFEDFIQTDAAINRGNSGGALVNTQGELIGINSQIYSPTGGNVGIGFAIPSNMAKSVMDQLRKSGKVRRGQLGIRVQKIDEDMAAGLGLSDARGLIVSEVVAGSAADRAGLRRNDVVLALNGEAVSDPNTFRNRIASTAPDMEVALTISREGREQQLRARLGEFKPEGSRAEGGREGEGGAGSGDAGGKLGVSVAPLTPEMISRLRLPAGSQGLYVSDVEATGPAGRAGVQPRDVIVEANRQPVRTTEDLRAAVQSAGERPVLLLINRSGTTFFVTVRPRQQ